MTSGCKYLVIIRSNIKMFFIAMVVWMRNEIITKSIQFPWLLWLSSLDSIYDANLVSKNLLPTFEVFPTLFAQTVGTSIKLARNGWF